MSEHRKKIAEAPPRETKTIRAESLAKLEPAVGEGIWRHWPISGKDSISKLSQGICGTTYLVTKVTFEGHQVQQVMKIPSHPRYYAALREEAKFTAEMYGKHQVIFYEQGKNPYDSAPAIFMPYFEGQTLFDYFSSDEFKRKKPSEKEKIMFQLFLSGLRILKYVHEEKGFAHLDPHGHNFIVTANGELKLIDFGYSPAGVFKREDKEGNKRKRKFDALKFLETFQIIADLTGISLPPALHRLPQIDSRIIEKFLLNPQKIHDCKCSKTGDQCSECTQKSSFNVDIACKFDEYPSVEGLIIIFEDILTPPFTPKTKPTRSTFFRSQAATLATENKKEQKTISTAKALISHQCDELFRSEAYKELNKEQQQQVMEYLFYRGIDTWNVRIIQGKAHGKLTWDNLVLNDDGSMQLRDPTDEYTENRKRLVEKMLNQGTNKANRAIFAELIWLVMDLQNVYGKQKWVTWDKNHKGFTNDAVINILESKLLSVSEKDESVEDIAAELKKNYGISVYVNKIRKIAFHSKKIGRNERQGQALVKTLYRQIVSKRPEKCRLPNYGFK